MIVGLPKDNTQPYPRFGDRGHGERSRAAFIVVFFAERLARRKGAKQARLFKKS
jgi:hypothetical protein